MGKPKVIMEFGIEIQKHDDQFRVVFGVDGSPFLDTGIDDEEGIPQTAENIRNIIAGEMAELLNKEKFDKLVRKNW